MLRPVGPPSGYRKTGQIYPDFCVLIVCTEYSDEYLRQSPASQLLPG